MNVLPISPTAALLVVLVVFVVFGALHLAALSAPDHPISKAYIALGF